MLQISASNDVIRHPACFYAAFTIASQRTDYYSAIASCLYRSHAENLLNIDLIASLFQELLRLI